MTHPRRAIECYLAEGLPTEAESELRQHLRDCAECRRFYDEEVLLRRALAGSPLQPTRTEDMRLRRLVLARTGLAEPGSTPARLAVRLFSARLGTVSWRFAFGIGATAAALFVCVSLIHLWRSSVPNLEAQRSLSEKAVLVGRLTQAKDLTMDGAAARASAAVLSGSMLMASGEGFAELELLRGGRVRLFPRTRLRLATGGGTIALESGKVWCEIDPGQGRFVVRTARGEARVLGTSFIVEEIPGGDTDVRVLAGAVDVEDVGHRGVVRLKDGQRTRMLLQAPPMRAQRYDPQIDRADWEQALRRLGRGLERTIRKLGDNLRLP